MRGVEFTSSPGHQSPMRWHRPHQKHQLSTIARYVGAFIIVNANMNKFRPVDPVDPVGVYHSLSFILTFNESKFFFACFVQLLHLLAYD